MQFFGGLESVGLHERDRLIELLDSGPTRWSWRRT
jgi:hypothetical protein